MASHRAQARFDRAQWRLAVLAPLWALQVLLAAALMGLFSWRLGETAKSYASEARGTPPTVDFAWEAVNVAMALVAIACTLTEMCKFAAESLTPLAMLLAQAVKMACAAVVLALDLALYVQGRERYYSLFGLGIDATFIIVTVAMAAYAVVAYRRPCAHDDYTYARPVNVKSYGYRDGYRDGSGLSHVHRASLRGSLDKRSLQSPRASVESMGMEPVRLQTRPTETVPPPGPYNHERDTQFDEYVARRSSRNGSSREGSPADDDMAMPVPLARTRPRGLSYASDHVLVPVLEEDAPEEDTEAAEPRVATDRDALMGGPRGRSDSADAKSLTGPPVLQEADVTEPWWLRS